jgi:hypothetical protein
MRPNQHFYNLLQFDATSGMTQSFILSIVGGTSSTYYSYNNTVSTLQTGSIPYVNPGTWEDVAYSEQLKRSVAVAGIVGATMNSIAYSDDLINYTFANGSFPCELYR